MSEKLKSSPEKPNKENKEEEGKPSINEIKQIRSEIFEKTGEDPHPLGALKEYVRRLPDPLKYRGPDRENIILNVIIEKEEEKKKEEWNNLYEQLRKEGKSLSEIKKKKETFDKETKDEINSKINQILKQIRESE